MANEADNLNPTPEALVAMVIWGPEYSEQMGGSMDFWEKLDKSRKNRCRSVVKEVHRRGEEDALKWVIKELEEIACHQSEWDLIDKIKQKIRKEV